MKIPRQVTKVTIFTKAYKIVADAYLPVQGRLTDFLNSRQEDKFIPLTDVHIFNIHDNSPLGQYEFCGLNSGEIVFITTEI